MSYDYTDDVTTAADMIADSGRSLTLRKLSIGTYDPATGTNTGTTTDSTVIGVMLDFAAGQTLVRGALIQAMDKRLLLPASAAVSPQDHILDGSTEYTIVSLGELKPGDTSLLFDLHLHA